MKFVAMHLFIKTTISYTLIFSLTLTQKTEIGVDSEWYGLTIID